MQVESGWVFWKNEKKKKKKEKGFQGQIVYLRYGKKLGFGCIEMISLESCDSKDNNDMHLIFFEDFTFSLFKDNFYDISFFC